ncbi:MAG: cation transporter [Clostridia bacterium]|nr:cation transporter [Clostridia bacterium]
MSIDTLKRGKETEKVGLVGIIGNIFLFVLKIIVALASKSQSMLADSINSGTDILSSIMTFVGGRISQNASDEQHNYGYGKAEYVFSLIISLIMGYLAVTVAAEGVKSLIAQSQFEFSYTLIVVCLITIITKIILYIYTNKIGKQSENILVLANSEDHKNDVLITSSVLVGILASKINIYFLDGLIAILIACKILIEATKFFMTSYTVLIDKSMNETKLEEIKEIIKSFKDIDHIDKITSKAAGKSFVIIIKVSVDGNMTVNKSHEIAGKLKAKVMELKDVYDVIVHINPV